MRLSRRRVPLTHLFYADDLLLLSEASCEQARVINSVLDVFCRSSGAKVSKTKTHLYFSRNVNHLGSPDIGEITGFSITSNLGEYLSLPLLHSRAAKETYQEIVDKVDKKLSGWNARHQSFAGRITLTQTVIQAIPIYTM